MKLKSTHPRIIINISLPDKPALNRWRARRRCNRAQLTMLQQRVIPALPPSPLALSATVNYPYCFLSSASRIKRNSFIIGAFLPALDKDDDQPVALYALVSDKWVKEQMNGLETLPFWLSRVLAPLSAESAKKVSMRRIADVREWCRILQKMVGSRHFKLASSENQRLSQRNKLHGECCDADFEFSRDDGVDAIPWRNWPDCVSHGENIWYWRQSRYGKIIEAHKLPIVSNLTNKV